MFLNGSLPAEMTTKLRVLILSQYLFTEQKAEDFIKTEVLVNYCFAVKLTISTIPLCSSSDLRLNASWMLMK